MTHKNNDISDLIPDYCNNRLNAEERADFESRLRQDRQLLDEFKDFQGFQELYRRSDPAEPSPSDAIFQQICRKAGVQPKVERKATQRFSSFAGFLGDFWRQIRQSIAVPWMLAAAQAVVIVLLMSPAPEQNRYATLSASKPAVTAEEITINVVFRDNAPESEIRSLLQEIQGSFSSGPSREGRYVVSIDSRKDLDQAVRTLKHSNIVVFAEAVY
jgi:anti-sigma-K factor RskA